MCMGKTSPFRVYTINLCVRKVYCVYISHCSIIKIDKFWEVRAELDDNESVKTEVIPSVQPSSPSQNLLGVSLFVKKYRAQVVVEQPTHYKTKMTKFMTQLPRSYVITESQ